MDTRTVRWNPSTPVQEALSKAKASWRSAVVSWAFSVACSQYTGLGGCQGAETWVSFSRSTMNSHLRDLTDERIISRVEAKILEEASSSPWWDRV